MNHVPPFDALLGSAIRERHLVQFTYKDEVRIAEPHDYGIAQNRVRLLALQVRGKSHGRLPGWRLFDAAHIGQLTMMEETFAGPAPDPVFSSRSSQTLSILVTPVRIENEASTLGGSIRMNQYLLSIYQPDGEPPPPPVLQAVMTKLNAVRQEMKAAGAWVFTGGLHAPTTATVVRVKDGHALMTDGPFTEGKEHIGGFVVINAVDLDAALAWGEKLARATTLPIEVRPFQGTEF